jgi:hypothetical protein
MIRRNVGEIEVPSIPHQSTTKFKIDKIKETIITLTAVPWAGKKWWDDGQQVMLVVVWGADRC